MRRARRVPEAGGRRAQASNRARQHRVRLWRKKLSRKRCSRWCNMVKSLRAARQAATSRRATGVQRGSPRSRRAKWRTKRRPETRALRLVHRRRAGGLVQPGGPWALYALLIRGEQRRRLQPRVECARAAIGWSLTRRLSPREGRNMSGSGVRQEYNARSCRPMAGYVSTRGWTLWHRMARRLRAIGDVAESAKSRTRRLDCKPR